MNKQLTLFLLVLATGIFSVRGQVYEGAAGLGIGFGDGSTLAGFSGKYFVAENHALQGELLFGNITGLNLLYAYHDIFSGTQTLQWFAGGGIGALFGSGDSDIGLRPLIGLDYKIKGVPLGFTFDWRPYISFDEGSEAGRFGIGIRYVWE